MPVTENVKTLARSSPYALLVVLAISSLVVGSCSVDTCSATGCGGWRTVYGIAWGFLSFCICGAMIALQFLRSDIGENVHRYLAPFFFVIWLITAGILTSSSGLFPFAGNGYFGVWISVFVSFYYWSLWAPFLNQVGGIPSMHGLSLLVILSCILWATAAEGCGVRGDCSGLWGFAIFVGVFITLVAGAQIGLLMFMPDIGQKYALYIGLVMWVTMVFGAGFLTNEKGLFPLIGNGYLATWGCFWVALYYSIIHSPFGDIVEDAGFQADNRATSPGFEDNNEFESRVGMEA